MELPKPVDAPEYMHIEENLYRFSDAKKFSDELLRCNCEYIEGRPETGCGENCMNRLTLMECEPDTCPCREHCRNQRFQLKQYAKVKIFKTAKKGYGLRTTEDLPPNSFVIEYVGEVLNKSQLHTRMKQYHNEKKRHFYFMNLLPNETLDATMKGNLSRFINHSCAPNCITQKWIVGEYMRMGFFTAKFVKAGSELTFDYKFEDYGDEPQTCYCEETNCRGTIGISRKSAEIIDDENEDEEDGLNEEDALRMEEIVTMGLKEVSEVPALMQSMVSHIHDEAKTLDHLRILEDTNNSACLRRAYQMEGLKLLKAILVKHKDNLAVLLAALNVLKRFPIAARNNLDKMKMFNKMQALSQHDDVRVSSLASSLLTTWNDLKSEYRIPKAVSKSEICENTTVVQKNSEAIASPAKSVEHSTEPDRSGWVAESPHKRLATRSPTKKAINEDLKAAGQPENRSLSKYPSHSKISSPERTLKRQRLEETTNTKEDLTESSLPRNWTKKYDTDGTLYFFNSLTNLKQNNIPTSQISATVEGYSASDLKEFMSKIGTNTGNLADHTSKETSNRIKAEVVEVVKRVLDKYKNTIDIELYKSLARKLSYSLTEKEISRLQASSEFDRFEHLTEKAKHKMKLYVEEHLLKIGISLKK